MRGQDLFSLTFKKVAQGKYAVYRDIKRVATLTLARPLFPFAPKGMTATIKLPKKTIKQWVKSYKEARRLTLEACK